MREDYFKDIYKDFFGIESSLTQSEKKEEKKEEVGPQTEMASLFLKINKLNISDDDKEMLKKMVEYMRKYHEGIENNYVPFRLIVETNTDTLVHNINDILYTAGEYFDYILPKQKVLSLYKINKEEDYHDYGFLLMHDLDGLNLLDTKEAKTFIYTFEDFLKEDSKNITLVAGSSEQIDGFFLGRENIKNKYFSFLIKGINPDIQDIYNDILGKVKIDDEMQVKLLDYLTSTYTVDVDYVTYENDLIKYISFNKELPVLKEEKTMEEIFASLDELVGLEKVKKVFHELVDVITLKEKAGDNLKIKDINLHMVFLGNPGTGKTTIARLIADILYNLKYIKENKLVEVSVKDLVAEYVGQTAPKTMSVIEKSMNGVLFIDEAYALATKDSNSYNGEAIATLIQAMENYRDKLVVIFAGYTKEMQAFLDSNSGITSRIGYTLTFDDYTTDELIEIFLGMTKKAGFEVEDDAINYLREIIDDNRHMKNFGNARFVRNIYEKTVIKHASNVKDKKQKKILRTITKKDINTENLILKKDE